MSRTALIVGGAGQIGLAVGERLLAAGWRVVAARRGEGATPPGVETLRLDRDEPGALARAIAGVAGGVDAAIDTVAYHEGHGRQWLELEDGVGALVVVSSASVYRDAEGRTIDEARATGFPEFPIPIGEDQPTVAAGPSTYSTRKVALEQTLLREARPPVTILRPCAVHGPGSRAPREWFFVRRILDGRRVVPLAWDGASRFHTCAAVNIAALTEAALAARATGIFNIADPDAPTVREIGETIAGVYGHDWRLETFEGPPVKGVGGHPWGIPRPVVVDMARADAIGYRPAATYAEAVGEACRSAERAARDGVAFAPYLATMFDYAAEDAFLAARD